MSALYFGPLETQLFGYYHPASGAGAGAALICPPAGLEYQYAHRALRTLARRLAERGCHVLRFDYSGTGDSWGGSADATLERWEDDVSRAIMELRRLSGRSRTDLIGLRLGALTAARAAARHTDIERVVLWDPLFESDATPAGASAQELLAAAADVRVLLLETEAAPRVQLPLSGAGRISHAHVPDVSPWLQDVSIWNGHVPARAVNRIVEWLTEA